MQTKLVVGIDPGWRNLGLAVLRMEEGVEAPSCSTYVLDPQSLGGITKTVQEISKLVGESPSLLTMERYVTYAGKNNPNSEDILMLTGALQYHFENTGAKIKLFRAIDWKPNLSKSLYRKGFRNPSMSFDKKFDIAAAGFILGREFTNTDHEADAVCLGYWGSVSSNS